MAHNGQVQTTGRPRCSARRNLRSLIYDFSLFEASACRPAWSICTLLVVRARFLRVAFAAGPLDLGFGFRFFFTVGQGPPRPGRQFRATDAPPERALAGRPVRRAGKSGILIPSRLTTNGSATSVVLTKEA